MSIAALITDLIAAGTPAELVGRVAAALAEREVVTVQVRDEAAERRRAADRERKANVRRIPQTSADNADSAPSPLVPPALSPAPPNPPPYNPPNPSAGGEEGSLAVATPTTELEAVLSSETASAIVEHRRRVKAPLTTRAAKALAKQLAKWPDPEEAAATMLARGWKGFEPDWMPKQPDKPPDSYPFPLPAWKPGRTG